MINATVATFGKADTGPVIARVETFSKEFLSFVRVVAEDGSEGWGQVAPYHADITAQILHRQIAPWVMGRDANDIAGPVMGTHIIIASSNNIWRLLARQIGVVMDLIGISHREPGGLSVRQMVDILLNLKLKSKLIVGADIVEYNPFMDFE